MIEERTGRDCMATNNELVYLPADQATADKVALLRITRKLTS